jgi:hypothetical protein
MVILCIKTAAEIGTPFSIYYADKKTAAPILGLLELQIFLDMLLSNLSIDYKWKLRKI